MPAKAACDWPAMPKLSGPAKLSAAAPPPPPVVMPLKRSRSICETPPVKNIRERSASVNAVGSSTAT